MTPQEKAKELVDKYYLNKDVLYETLSWIESKQCALIAVNEVIEELVVTDFANRFGYWQQVKTEIKKL